MPMETDVLIVGAGPVGLTLANDLAVRGISFRIVDLLAAATRNSRAHGLQSRTLEALDRLNLAEPILAAAQHPQPPFLILSGGKVVVRLDFASFLHEPYPYTLVVWQQRIERVLESALRERGHSVQRSTRLLSFDMDARGVTARVETASGAQDTIRAQWIVGCDGGHSTVRERLGLKMEGKTLPGRFWLGEFDIQWKRSRDTMYEWWHKGGMAGALFIDFTNKWHVFVESEKIPEGSPDLAQMQELFRETTGDQDVVLSNPSWISTLTINQRMPNRFLVNRAILAGDAAHVHSGAGGQGMNTGIQDALNLGWKLALVLKGAASPALLRSYESERLPNARSLLRYTLKYHRIQIPRTTLARWIATAFFRMIQAIRPLGYAVAKRVGMLDLNYERSPLSGQASPSGTPETRAGWHVPDAPCRLDGRATRLFEVLRGPQAHVLLFAGATPTQDTFRRLANVDEALRPYAPHVRVLYIFASESEAGALETAPNVIIDGGQHLQTAFGMRAPEAIYVRPDGYIGFRGGLDSRALVDYLGLIYAHAGKAFMTPSRSDADRLQVAS